MPTIDIDSPAVQSYLSILQGVINRMAANSSNSKGLCITLVSATIVIVADKGKPDFVWIGLIPIVLFFCLDAYYLMFERAFRDQYSKFVKKLHDGEATATDVYVVTPGSSVMGFLKAIFSISVAPFYGFFVVTLLVAWSWLR